MAVNWWIFLLINNRKYGNNIVINSYPHNSNNEKLFTIATFSAC